MIDADGDPVTAETDEDGVFEFEGLVVRRYYFLMPEEHGPVHRGQNRQCYQCRHQGPRRPTDVVSEALATARVPEYGSGFRTRNPELELPHEHS